MRFSPEFPFQEGISSQVMLLLYIVIPPWNYIITTTASKQFTMQDKSLACSIDTLSDDLKQTFEITTTLFINIQFYL